MLFIFFERTTYHLEMEVGEFTILTGKKTIFQKEAHVTVVYGLVHQLMCQVRLGCLPIITVVLVSAVSVGLGSLVAHI